MDDDDGGSSSSYARDSYSVNNHHGYGSSQKSKFPAQNSTYPKPGENNHYDNQEDEDEELGEEEDEVEEDEDTDVNGILGASNGDHEKEGGGNYNDDDDNSDNEDDSDNEESRGGSSEAHRHHQKKQKLKSILSSYELVPRLQPPMSTTNNVARSSSAKSTGGRNPLTDWTEHETSVLLDAWGECFLHHGRKSLRSDEWHEVAEKVSQQSRVERTDSQCRNRLDTLKKRYKKEKTMAMEARGGAAVSSKWVFFRKMDMLMSSPSQQPGLSCGMDSGEYVFMNPKVYLNRANGLDEMKDSPGNSASSSQEGDGGGGSDELPPPRRRKGMKRKKMRPGGGGSFQLLADSVQKFNMIYEEIETKKRQQMIQLEKIRMDFHREIEMQRRQILERVQAEIVKIRQGCDDDDDGGDDENDEVSDENGSG